MPSIPAQLLSNAYLRYQGRADIEECLCFQDGLSTVSSPESLFHLTVPGAVICLYWSLRFSFYCLVFGRIGTDNSSASSYIITSNHPSFLETQWHWVSPSHLDTDAPIWPPCRKPFQGFFPPSHSSVRVIQGLATENSSVFICFFEIWSCYVVLACLELKTP